MSAKQRVVIIGGGFGGLYAAQSLRYQAVDITLIDRRNFHLFQPLLYQVATGGLSPANIAAPIRSVLRHQRNVKVLLGEVKDFDLEQRQVILADGQVPYDILIVATGARHSYFGHPEWEKAAPGLKTLEDATEIRRRVLLAFEQAERCSDPVKQKALMTFVVVGGGPTGVELAGAVAELSRHTLRKNFRTIDPATATVYLLEGLDRVLTAYPVDLSKRAFRSLTQLGVTVNLGTQVVDIQPEQVVVKRGEQTEVIPCHTVLWGAGVQASPLAALLAKKTGIEVDRAGRLQGLPDLTLPGHPEVFALGDMINYSHQTGKPLPGVAQVAIQQAKYVAQTIERRLKGKSPQPFKYKDLGNMATIGRNSAIADLGWLHLSGIVAWMAWLFIHVLYLINFENRILVVSQWAWSYFTRGRSARLITWLPSSLEMPATKPNENK